MTPDDIEQQHSLGVPHGSTPPRRHVPPADSKLVARETEEPEFIPTDDPMDELFGLEKLLRWPLLRYAAVVLVGLVALVVLSQGVSLLNEIEQLPQWAHAPGYAALGLLALAILLATIRLAGAFFSLERTPRIAMRTLRELQERDDLRRTATLAFREARRKLERYVRSYPHDKRRLQKLGFADVEVEALRLAREDLLSGQASRSTEDAWLADCEQNFVSVLDEAARRRVKRCARQVGLKTAVAPTGFIDGAIVIVNAHIMVADLCRIYNLRTTKVGTTAILLRTALNLLVATQLEDATQELWEAAERNLGKGIRGLPVIGPIVSRTAEGSANYVLCRRLGRAVMRHLRPLRDKL